MNHSQDIVQIRGSAMHRRPHTFAEYVTLSRAYLKRLHEINGAFQRLSVLVESDYRVVSPDLVGLEEIIATACCTPENQQDIINATPSKVLESESLNRIGFSISYFSYAEDLAHSHISVEDGGIKITVQGSSAGAEPSCGVILTFSAGQCENLRSSTTLRLLLGATVEIWQHTVGNARSMRFERAVKQEGDIYTGQWLQYLPFPHLGECLPRDIRWEPFHTGILIETTPHPPDANNPSDVAAGKRVREVLDEFGFAWQSTYAIHGWPPDEEEWRYEEFITGAPSGRKYRVRCIDFDGYDAERKVLLYAKLFRLLRRKPKQWGLRGWDGPVINEARRQVRAANGQSIEWHIGLEESAERVRTLLAEYTDITEKQLKIIYTPLQLALQSHQRTES